MGISCPQGHSIPHACVRAKSLRSCLTLCDPTDCSPPGSSLCGILQARRLEWVAVLQQIFLTHGSNLCLLTLSALAGGFFTTNATWEAHPISHFSPNGSPHQGLQNRLSRLPVSRDISRGRCRDYSLETGEIKAVSKFSQKTRWDSVQRFCGQPKVSF